MNIQIRLAEDQDLIDLNIVKEKQKDKLTFDKLLPGQVFSFVENFEDGFILLKSSANSYYSLTGNFYIVLYGINCHTSFKCNVASYTTTRFFRFSSVPNMTWEIVSVSKDIKTYLKLTKSLNDKELIDFLNYPDNGATFNRHGFCLRVWNF